MISRQVGVIQCGYCGWLRNKVKQNIGNFMKFESKENIPYNVPIQRKVTMPCFRRGNHPLIFVLVTCRYLNIKFCENIFLFKMLACERNFSSSEYIFE